MDFKTVILICFFPLFLFCKDSFIEPWGEDTTLLKTKPPPPIQNITTGKKIANAMIHFYQDNISPANGPKSNFRPTSSRYTELAIYRYGFIKGFIMGCDRLMRENTDPWVYRTIDINGKTIKYDPPDKIKESRSR